MKNRIARTPAGPYLLLIVIAFFTLFFRLGALPFIGSDECRYARIAEEMSGARQWVTPILEGLPWLEKPPLYYWITIPMIRWFGMSEMAARLSSVFCALTGIALVVWLGTRLWTRRAGFWSGMILLTGIGYCAYGRSASTDMPFTASFTIAFALLASAVLKKDASRWRIGCAYVFLGLAVLAKGPVGWILAAGILLLFWVFDEQGGSFRQVHAFWGGIISAVVALPWFWLAFQQNGFSFVSIFFINHNFARYVTDVHHHDQPIVYFVPVLFGLFFPWSGWLPALIPDALRSKIRNWRTWDRSTVFLLSWALFPFLFFSLSGSKLPGYVLPCMPPIALLLSRRLQEILENEPAGSKLRFARWFGLILSLLLAIALPIVFQIEYGGAWKSGLFIALAFLVPAVMVFVCAGRGRWKLAVQATATQGIICLLAVMVFGSSLVAAYHSTREISGQALSEAGGDPMITYCFFHHTLHYYTGYRLGANITDPGSLLEYASQQPRFLAITEYPQVANLQQMVQLSVVELGGQGKLRLLRITRK